MIERLRECPVDMQDGLGGEPTFLTFLAFGPRLHPTFPLQVRLEGFDVGACQLS